MPVIAGRVSSRRLDVLAAAARDAALTYEEVGATRGELPARYRHGRHRIDLGDESETFEHACEGLRRWEPHRFAGATIVPERPPLIEGQSVVVAVRFGAVTMVAPTRIVYVTEERDRFGFAYGTLAGHPESGEESFHVVREHGAVRFEVAVFWRPSALLARLGGPVSKLAQARVTQRYLMGIKRYVEQASTAR